MLPYPLASIDAEKIEEICRGRFSESATLDFKRSIPGRDGGGVAELAKDVSAMANADGGDLVFGIDEVDAAASAIAPITTETADQAQRRIFQVIDSNIEPRLRGVHMKAVDVPGGYVLIVRVPASFDGPHCTRNSNSQRRFVSRNGTTTSDMSFEQIRMAFDRTSLLVDRARKQIEHCLFLVQDRKTARALPEVPLSAFEFVPLASIAGRASVNVAALNGGDYNHYVPESWRGGLNHTLNLDGMFFCRGSSGYQDALGTMFRDGRYEAVRTAGQVRDNDDKIIWLRVAMDFFRQSLEAALRLSKASGIGGPAIVRLALCHVEGYEFVIKNDFFDSGPSSSKDNHLVLPEIWIEDVSANVDVKTLLSDAMVATTPPSHRFVRFEYFEFMVFFKVP